MTGKELAELNRFNQTMPLADLVKVKQTISQELDARDGRTKFQPHRAWADLFKRESPG